MLPYKAVITIFLLSNAGTFDYRYYYHHFYYYYINYIERKKHCFWADMPM